MKLKEMIKQIQERNLKNLEGIEVRGFKTKIYKHNSGKYEYKDLYAYKRKGGKKYQIFLGKPETIEEIEEKIEKYLESR